MLCYYFKSKFLKLQDVRQIRNSRYCTIMFLYGIPHNFQKSFVRFGLGQIRFCAVDDHICPNYTCIYKYFQDVLQSGNTNISKYNLEFPISLSLTHMRQC